MGDATMIASPFPAVEKCSSKDRGGDTIVADLDGTLLCGRSSFPYFAHMAFETGGVLRLLALILLAPLAGVLYYLVSESAGIQVLIFASMAGARVADVEAVARAVLPKFYCSDIHPESWRVFSACGRRCVLTANPRMMVEAFLKEYLGADIVVGTELVVWRGRATGLVRSPGVLVGENKAAALREAFGDASPEIGIGDRRTDYPFMRLCKEGYVVPVSPTPRPVPREELPKPVVFHDGRLVQKPSPALALLTVLWIPIGFVLACLRIAAGALLPMRVVYHAFRALGVRVTVKGTPPPPASRETGQSGVLFICSHRTLLDPIFLSTALGRPITAVTYSVSRLSEILSPIRTVRLTRDRAADAAMIRRLLAEGDLVICPEGTTCREPFLLRFSALFAELTDEIVPVAMENQMSMFHGTTARGWKALDPFYFFMNPSPGYVVTFLSKLPGELTCNGGGGGGGGRSSHEVANYIQRLIASTLSYECTSFTRKDKYRALAGNDGTVVSKPNIDEKKAMGC
ncbi:glycerol-3-phosphate acyltransferase RAM2 [Oryza sativa Japonica Group]|nr:glycerol-3-phosphate 2-O-acyltransferase 6 [Oryza sativa Japonica Group]AAR07089.1 unknown protein [Oryza sativa Japonica Group]KAF2941183.1 hypothetical protein DAI22_03g329500 [Oryza sativa Japonica Group]BAF13103.1 Os03g0735900 [Oryza sativa Japonica Group]|eukprot:NP_001051189.1 Os03g0735900 [Oryza sativa Japonica Group]